MDWLENKTILVTDGDSWTAGDLIDPKLLKKGVTNINDPRNDYYRLTKVWPHKLGSDIDLDVYNIAVAGSSNDGILRRTLNTAGKLLEDYSRNEILYIVGFSSPERKDFYFEQAWDTLYPVEIKEWDDATTEQEKFATLYTKHYWEPEEYITRYITTVVAIDSYLSSLKIDHIFFDAFYENEFGLINSKSLNNFIDNFANSRSQIRLEYLELDNLIKRFKEIRRTNYIKKSFLTYLKEKFKQDINTKALHEHHPNENSHELWAKYLARQIKKPNL